MDEIETCFTDGDFIIKEERIPRSILIVGLREGTSPEKVIIHFQRKRNGGGDIESIVVNKAKRTAVITFYKEEVLQTVGQGEHVINDVTLQVQPYVALGIGDEDYRVFERVSANFRLETLKHFSREEVKELLKRSSRETGVEWHESSCEFIVSGSFKQIKECRCSLQQACVQAKEDGRPILNGPGHGREEPPLERDENQSVRGAYRAKTSSDGVNGLLNEEPPMTPEESGAVARTSNSSTAPNPGYLEIIPKFMSFLAKAYSDELETLERKYDVELVKNEDGTGIFLNRGENCDDQKHDEACNRFIRLYTHVFQNMQLVRFSLKNDKNVVHSRQLINEVCKKHPLLVDISTNRKHWELYGEKETVKQALKELQQKVEIRLVAPVARDDPSSDEEEVMDVDQHAEVPTLERPLQTLLGKVRLSVYKGDITDERVDAIVNAANGDLILGSGVAGAVLRKGGRSIEEDCRKILKRGKSLKDGDAVATSAGDLPCKIVIHAVGPKWYVDRGKKSRNILRRACLNSFCVAKDSKMTSVALPAISSGLFGMPKDVCAEVMFDAVDEFSRQQDSRKNVITDIRFVNIDDDTVLVFRKEFMKRYKTHQEQMQPKGAVKGASGLHGKGPNPRSSKGRGRGKSARYDDPRRVENGRSSTGAKTYSDALKNDNDSEDHPLAASSTIGKNEDADDTSEGATAEPECAICLDAITNPRVLRCDHVFCGDCIREALKWNNFCPVCKEPQGVIKGDQPPGEMSSWVTHHLSLPGYPGDGIITVNYYFPSGIQGPEHPNPGKPFSGTRREAYLPNNREGREVLQLLGRAFDARLVFTVGRSVTTGMDNQVTWNDIHHKTSMTGGPHGYGYPDPDYLRRVKEDLAAKGIR